MLCCCISALASCELWAGSRPRQLDESNMAPSLTARYLGKTRCNQTRQQSNQTVTKHLTAQLGHVVESSFDNEEFLAVLQAGSYRWLSDVRQSDTSAIEWVEKRRRRQSYQTDTCIFRRLVTKIDTTQHLFSPRHISPVPSRCKAGCVYRTVTDQNLRASMHYSTTPTCSHQIGLQTRKQHLPRD
jgi:hypothetical protein